MISLKEMIMSEVVYSMYQCLVYVEFDDNSDNDITHVAQLVRALPRVTVVNNRSDKTDKSPKGYLLIKTISTKSGSETYAQLKKDALSSIGYLKKFNYVDQHIEKLNF